MPYERTMWGIIFELCSLSFNKIFHNCQSIEILFETENERQKTKPVPIPLPRASRNFPDVKTILSPINLSKDNTLIEPNFQ